MKATRGEFTFVQNTITGCVRRRRVFSKRWSGSAVFRWLQGRAGHGIYHARSSTLSASGRRKDGRPLSQCRGALKSKREPRPGRHSYLTLEDVVHFFERRVLRTTAVERKCLRDACVTRQVCQRTNKVQSRFLPSLSAENIRTSRTDTYEFTHLHAERID